MKVLTAEIAHETNTFSCHRTDEQAFRNCYLLLGKDALAERSEANTEVAGFTRFGNENGWQIDHIISAAAGPSGKVTRQAFEYITDPIISAVQDNQYDGILLGLHGAMVTDFCEDGEGELLERLRAVVGPDLPIAITLDLHANVTQRMCSLANIIVAYKTYPHVDLLDAGFHAAGILNRTMSGDINPRTIRVARPMLEEVNGGRTDLGPMIGWISQARAYETENDVFAVSINAGFASADIAEVGPTVLVTGQGDFAAHTAFAEAIADDIWTTRHDVLNDYLSVEAAAAIALEFDANHGPLIIADYADNPGAGGYGDSTSLLRALLEAGVTNGCFGPMVDPEVAGMLHEQTIGDRVQIDLGGKTDNRFGGGPLHLVVELISISNGEYVGDGPMMGGLRRSFGPCAVIRVDGIEILVVTISSQILDRQQFKTFGIDPESKAVVALKSMQHFRAAFEPIAGKVIVCDSGAICTPHYELLSYLNVRRPMFPLDSSLD
ncbi:MAG: microcystin degradation protein MlrC [Gammaproteobacteria bacterium]|jgi:microcystin degradation protein MlrC